MKLPQLTHYAVRFRETLIVRVLPVLGSVTVTETLSPSSPLCPLALVSEFSPPPMIFALGGYPSSVGSLVTIVPMVSPEGVGSRLWSSLRRDSTDVVAAPPAVLPGGVTLLWPREGVLATLGPKEPTFLLTNALSKPNSPMDVPVTGCCGGLRGAGPLS